MKQIPTYKERGTPKGMYDPLDGTYHVLETNTDYLNKHAEEWVPPLGIGLHLHLIYSKQVHWRVVDRASSVCKILNRCRRVNIQEMPRI